MQIFADGILRDKVVLITGGGTGIGRRIALSMAAYGAQLVLAGRHLNTLGSVATEVKTMGGKALPVHADIRQNEQIDAMLQAAIGTFGRLDVLVNNAAGSFLSAARKITPKGWQSVIDTTLNGTFYCSQAVGLRMIEQGGGKIINITATLHFKGSPGMIAPTAAKAGVEAMTKTLALEWAKFNIQTNGIGPGYFATSQTEPIRVDGNPFNDFIIGRTPAGCWGDPDDLQGAAIFLSSNASNFVNGQIIYVDGGILATIGKPANED